MIAVTGARGYVGSRLLSHLAARDVPAVALSRAGGGRASERRFVLGECVAPELLQDVTVLVHAAWDFRARDAGANVRGSSPLVELARARSVPVVLVSSLAAHRHCRSAYGRAKLELERLVLADGGAVVRPGLVFGEEARGLFGAIDRALARLPAVPLPDGGHQRLYLSEESALCETLHAVADEPSTWHHPVLAAHDEAISLRRIAEVQARRAGRVVRIIPVPAALVRLGLEAIGATRFPLAFRADSLVGLDDPIPRDELSMLAPPPNLFPSYLETMDIAGDR